MDLYRSAPRNPEVRRWLVAERDKHRCQCGCGAFVQPTLARWSAGKSLRFIKDHQNRGKNHPQFKGGQIIQKGYVWLLRPEHPRTSSGGYVKRCWLIMEKFLGRSLKPGELVHHRDGDKMNDSEDNLQVTTSSAHARGHAPKVRDHGRFPKTKTP